MIKRLFILFFLYLPMQLLAQHGHLRCGPDTIAFWNGCENHFDQLLGTPYKETDTLHLPPQVMDSARAYLYKRLGNSFYKRLNYYQCQVIDWTTYKKQRDRDEPDKRVRYAVQYFFSIQDSLKYYFSIVSDKDFRIISKNFIPDINKNKDCVNFLPACDIKPIAEKDTVYPGKTVSVTPGYNDSLNCFTWKVEKPEMPTKKTDTQIRGFLIYNATTGKLIHRERYWIRDLGGTPSF
jgi:signal recognition particle subunit SEC65